MPAPAEASTDAKGASSGHTRGVRAVTRFLDPRVLARIGNLDLVARAVVDGFLSGLHRTLFKGVSTDFSEHRAYTLGDDVRRIDWRLYARTERLHIKTFEAETNADLMLALDSSHSMDYASGELSKFDYARMLLASLAHLGSRQRDRVGFATLASDLLDVLLPAAGRRDATVAALNRAKPVAGSELSTALQRLGSVLIRRSMVVVVSDFYLEIDTAMQALGGLRARGHDVIAIQILDPEERLLNMDGAQVLRDLETGQLMPVVPGEVRERYRELIDQHIAQLTDGCVARGIDFVSLDTSQPLDLALFHFLSRRAQVGKRRGR
ncbi:MAG: hypothetical protein ACI9DC_002275 [Gammaproteobacteria bacterium]|jgi:uncharacterized protein (DUF58 family)